MTTAHLKAFLAALRAEGVTEYEGPVGEFVVNEAGGVSYSVGRDVAIKVKLGTAPARPWVPPTELAPPNPAPAPIPPEVAALRAQLNLDPAAIADLAATLSG